MVALKTVKILLEVINANANLGIVCWEMENRAIVSPLTNSQAKSTLKMIVFALRIPTVCCV